MDDYKLSTMNAYREHAKKYSEKYKELADTNRRAEFNRFIDLISGKNILDMGCGSGDHAVYFKSKGLDVTCIDLSEEMIRICRMKGLNAQVMDMETMTFAPASFDGVWAVTSVIHVPKSKIKNVIKKIYDVLKNKGILFICVKKGEGEGLIKDKEGDTQRFFAFWEEDELIKEFSEYFDVIESEIAQFKGQEFVQIFLRKK